MLGPRRGERCAQQEPAQCDSHLPLNSQLPVFLAGRPIAAVDGRAGLLWPLPSRARPQRLEIIARIRAKEKMHRKQEEGETGLAQRGRARRSRTNPGGSGHGAARGTVQPIGAMYSNKKGRARKMPLETAQSRTASASELALPTVLGCTLARGR